MRTSRLHALTLDGFTVLMRLQISVPVRDLLRVLELCGSWTSIGRVSSASVFHLHVLMGYTRFRGLDSLRISNTIVSVLSS